MITHTREDYLRALYVMDEKKGEMRSTDIASYLRVSKPTVSEMVRNLTDEGFIRSSPYSKIEFTPKGKRRASKLTSKHRIIELFLKDVLKLRGPMIHEEAHRLEHAFSDESIVNMRKMLGNPHTDPHGKPIPWSGH